MRAKLNCQENLLKIQIYSKSGRMWRQSASRDGRRQPQTMLYLGKYSAIYRTSASQLVGVTGPGESHEQGCQVWPGIGSDWPKLKQIWEFFSSDLRIFSKCTQTLFEKVPDLSYLRQI